MVEKKSNLLVPAIATTLVVAGAASGAYFYFKGGSLSNSANSLSGAKVIPSQAILAASITTDKAAWSQLEQFQTPETRKLFDDTLKNIQQQALAKNPDISFEQDIQPWAGNVMVAILPTANKPAKQSQLQPPMRYAPVAYLAQNKPDSKSTPEPNSSPSAKPASEANILLVVEVKDKGSAAKFADKVKAKAGGKIEQKEYKGVQISQFKNGETSSTNTALLGDYLAISPQSSTIEKAIDTFKGEPSFASAIDSKALDLKTPLMQIYMPKFADSVQELTALNAEANELPPQSLEQLKQIKSVTVGLGVDNDGLRLKGVTKFDPAANRLEYKAAAGKVISMFPSETLALITGSDIKTRWNQFTQDASKNPDLQKNLEEARQNFKKEPFNLDIDKDIFGWMDGEAGLAFITTKEGPLAQYGALPAFIFQTSSRPTAEATLKKLETLAQGNGLKVDKKDVKGVSVTQWSTPSLPGAILGYGWSQSDSLFIGIGNLGEVLASKPANPLDSNQTFKTVTGSLDKSNIGYFYLDMDKTWSVISAQMPPEEKSKITPEANAVINTIRGIGVTAAMPEKTTSQFEFLLSLKPKGGK